MQFAAFATARLREPAQLALSFDGDTLKLGTEVVLARGDFEPHRAEALLAAAFGTPVAQRALPYVKRAIETRRDNQLALSLTHLALAGLPKLADPDAAGKRMQVAEELMQRGVAPAAIIAALKPDPLDGACRIRVDAGAPPPVSGATDQLGKYNPNHDREGRFTTPANAVSPGSNPRAIERPSDSDSEKPSPPKDPRRDVQVAGDPRQDIPPGDDAQTIIDALAVESLVNRGLTAQEAAIANKGLNVLGSPYFQQLREAYSSGVPKEVAIGGYTIIYEPDIPANISGVGWVCHGSKSVLDE